MASSQCLLKIVRPVCLPKYTRVFSLTECAPSRRLHYEKGKVSKTEVFSTAFPRRYADENAQGDTEVKRKDEETLEKKVEMKDWTERGPAWVSRDQSEGDLVKHIEVLQRFADRYNATYGPSGPNTSESKEENSDENRKRLLKILDKQPNKKYSTYVRALEKKRKDLKKMRKEKHGALRAFITLANEPRRKEATTPKPKPMVPSVKEFKNPDSVLLTSPLSRNQSQSPRPRIYSLINPKMKNRDYEAYLKKNFPTFAKRDTIKEKKQEATIGEYFTGRYAPARKTKGPDAKTQEFSASLKDSLLEGRRTSTDKKVQQEPMIHPKTSLLVQRTHLPLTRCKNVQETDKPSVKPEKVDPGMVRKPPPPPEAETRVRNTPKDNNLLDKLIKYFKR